MFCPLFALLWSQVCAAAAGPAQTQSQTQTQSTVDRVVQDEGIQESSGLAASPLHAGILWTVNDGGGATVFALGTDGNTAAKIKIKKAPKVNWEAVVSLRNAGGTPMLAIGDIGDNDEDRASVDIVLIAEPQKLEDGTILPDLVLRLAYPDGASDAETLLADPRTNRLYLVTKTDPGIVHAVPQSVWPGDSNAAAREGQDAEGVAVRNGRLERLAPVELPMATDGTILPDGRLALRSNTDLVLLPAVETWTRGSTVQPLHTTVLPEQEQGESLTLSGEHLLLGSEGKNQPILRLALPGGVNGTAPTGGADDVTGADGGPPADLTDSRRQNHLVAWGLGCLVLAVGLGTVLLRRRRAQEPKNDRQ
ncbi:MAG: hypothetical protein QG608_2983 [Actinomycetota bacterium]|nr:hypothetical protein [Actinomycetota bacterium]